MAHFAQLDPNNKVIDVCVVSDNFDGKEDEYSAFAEGVFKQTSYNTRAGVHELGGTPFRKNYAGIGFTYDPVRDAFIPPKLYPSMILNEDTCHWEFPTPCPEPVEGKTWYWSEKAQDWKELVIND
ncbi:hypothetical protein uvFWCGRAMDCOMC403_05 [Freshwater phage uvFW-CGR-AMD-COM-C403]|nr:hypothetical protein uvFWCGRAMDCOMC403_05 [Freshwater phage uvFW-CGR-AMD-COM-C403]